jgi:hypothetical protein
MDQLLRNETGPGRHPLYPAYSGAVVAEQRTSFLGETATDMFHH